MEWQPIETAPKDGTFILVATQSAQFPYFPYPLKQRWIDGKWLADDGRHYEPEPTHWMPLPPPPTVTR